MPSTPESETTSPATQMPPRWWRRRRVVVADESMSPTLRPGDRLWVDTGAYRHRLPAAGEIVVLVDPEAADRWLVKRVATADASRGTIEVRGDALDRARDSRRFGPVPTTSVVGRAYELYFPADRRRPL